MTAAADPPRIASKKTKTGQKGDEWDGKKGPVIFAVCWDALRRAMGRGSGCDEPEERGCAEGSETKWVPAINANMLAKAIGVPANRITGDTAVRFGAFFNTTAEFWMNLQKTYELRLAEKSLSGRVTRKIQENREALGEAV